MGTKNLELRVVELSGTARSGKGTVLGHLEKTRGVATDETGADYRAVTKGLLNEGAIERGMARVDIRRELAKVGFGALADLAANRGKIVDEHGLSSLYEPEVNELVSLVSPFDHVRQAVKAGFRRRVAKVRDSDEHEVLVVDGRNLAPTVESVEGTQLLLRTFFSCSPVEAALRECMRSGIDLSGPEGQSILQSIRDRNKNDADRLVDPVRPDEKAFKYMHAPETVHAAIRYYADTLYGGDFESALNEVYGEVRPSAFRRKIRLGEGAVAAAVADRSQIHLDTTFFRGEPDSKTRMLEVAGDMFDEALQSVPTN